MSGSTRDITADAIALQERDEFRAAGWLKLIAPAKVNLHLGIGARRPDGLHEVTTVLHALNLHDVVYLRRKQPAESAPVSAPSVRMIATGDVAAPEVAPEDNLAYKAACSLAKLLDRPADLEIRIEKNIPSQAGLGGGSSDAAAVLVGAARLWNVADDAPVLERAARELGSDVTFFLRGGCALYVGAGEVHQRSLAPSRQAVALVKPEFGIPTGAAYRMFDEQPGAVPAEIAEAVGSAQDAAEIALFNNLAAASERLQPQLADIRAWLTGQPGVEGALLCGSGAATFAVCRDFQAACRVVAAARERGLWARATSFGSAKAMPVSGGDAL